MVRIGASPPPPPPIDTAQDAEICGRHHPDPDLVVSSESGALGNVVVTLVGPDPGRAERRKPTTAELRQQGCLYRPHGQVIAPGSELKIYNDDPLMHNIHAYLGRETLFNMAQPKFLKVMTRRLDRPGVVRLRCDVHSWMTAWILVTDEPRVAITDEGGRFRLEDVPPGTWRLQLWHEVLGESTRQLVMPEAETLNVDLVMGEEP